MTIQVYLLLKNKRTGLNSTFTFKKVDKEQISKSNEIPLRIIKEFSDIFGGFLTKNFNECLDKAFSQINLNVQRMSQLKNNYSPVSILSNTSKLYEDPVQGFSHGRKNEKGRNNKEVFVEVLIELSKAFDCIPHGLIIAKLNAFGFDKNRCPLFLPITITDNKQLR